MPDAKSADETRADALTYKLQRLSNYREIPSTERLIDPYFPLGGQICGCVAEDLQDLCQPELGLLRSDRAQLAWSSS